MDNRCSATAKRTGQQCKRAPQVGARVCHVHGGAARQVKAAAARRAVEADARRTLTMLAAVTGPAAPVDDPLSELAALAGEAKRWKELMAERVAVLTAPGYAGMTGEQIKADVQLFERAMDRLGTLLVAFAKLNIDERLAAISERQAEIVLDAIDVALIAADVPIPQRTVARVAAGRHLRAVSS